MANGVGVASEGDEHVFVGDRSVVANVEEPVTVGDEADGDDEDLDLERLHLVGEDLSEHLGVLVGQRLGVDVVSAVGVALEVGMADTGDSQLVVLVVATDTGEGDAVIDLGDLAKVP